jgi:hypothetical protein
LRSEILKSVGERVTTEITRSEDAKNFTELEGAALRGGKVSGKARKNTEQEIGRKVSTKENYLDDPEKKLK